MVYRATQWRQHEGIDTLANIQRAALFIGERLFASSRRLGISITGVAMLALLLSACGATPASSGSSGSPKLTCATLVSGHSIDLVTAQLTCHVTGASASDTAFSLKYRVTDDSGQGRVLSATCSGPLSNGVGSCTQSYSAPVPMTLTPATVSGETTPSHQALGPVTPAEHDATPAPGQHL